ncbi:MAG: GNAT family N-acetyltransferase [Rhodobacteraceae bacterium]|jgi:putative acetyltransferase|nr:GNAT family N-acetyltransferase [Paracoccaceae bacterium]
MTLVFTLRTATPDDFDQLGLVMFRAIHEGPSPYTQAQRKAWLPRQNRGVDWAARLGAQKVVLGAKDGKPVGFMTLAGEGYVDFAYILPDARGQGVFAALLAEIETRAIRDGVTQLWTHASLMAQPAFARHGFAVNQHETITRDGESLLRAKMSKPI